MALADFKRLVGTDVVLNISERCFEILDEVFKCDLENALYGNFSPPCVEIGRTDMVGQIAAQILLHAGLIERFAGSDLAFTITELGKMKYSEFVKDEQGATVS